MSNAIVEALTLIQLQALADVATGKNGAFLRKTAVEAERRFREKYVPTAAPHPDSGSKT